MNVKCISNNLTIGKFYKVINIDYYYCNYKIIDDSGYTNTYSKEYFKPISEMRNEKIDKLLE